MNCEPESSSPVHGTVSCTDGNHHKSLCDYICDDGYKLSDPQARYRVCDRQKWSRKEPTCEGEITYYPPKEWMNRQNDILNKIKVYSIRFYSEKNYSRLSLKRSIKLIVMWRAFANVTFVFRFLSFWIKIFTSPYIFSHMPFVMSGLLRGIHSGL